MSIYLLTKKKLAYLIYRCANLEVTRVKAQLTFYEYHCKEFLLFNS